jgi:hypothetical protein
MDTSPYTINASSSIQRCFRYVRHALPRLTLPLHSVIGLLRVLELPFLCNLTPFLSFHW